MITSEQRLSSTASSVSSYKLPSISRSVTTDPNTLTVTDDSAIETEDSLLTIWKAVRLACKSRGLDIEHWEVVLPDALHSIRSLLCTATNVTPHERMFSFPRRSATGESMPSWLNPGPVYLKRRVRTSKHEPLVDEVELLEANPNYAHIRFPDGREDTVSLSHLAPRSTMESTPETIEPSNLAPQNTVEQHGTLEITEPPQSPIVLPINDQILLPPVPPTLFPTEVLPRRSERNRKGPREKLDL